MLMRLMEMISWQLLLILDFSKPCLELVVSLDLKKNPLLLQSLVFLVLLKEKLSHLELLKVYFKTKPRMNNL